MDQTANNTDNVKRDAMIDMLQALDTALATRVTKWIEKANSVPRVVLSPRQGKKNRGHVTECKIRIDELQEIRKLVKGTIATCEEQNAGPAPGAEVVQ